MITYENRMKLYLWRRNNRENTQTGRAPISIRILIDGFPRAELLTRVLATAKEWSQAAGRKIITRGLSREEQQLLELDNQTLAKHTLALHQGYHNQKSQGYHPSPKDLLDLLRVGKSNRHGHDQLLVLCERFYADAAAGKFGARTTGSLSAYRTRIGVLTRYLEHLKRPQLRAEEVTKKWARALDRWLIDEQGFRYPTIQAVLNLLGAVLVFAEAEGLIAHNDFQGYKQLGKADAPAQRHLTKEELEAFAQFVFPRENQTRAQHIWVFSAYTGLSPVDYRRFAQDPARYLKTVPLDAKHPDKGSVLVIEIDRQKMQSKNGRANWIPLLPSEPPYMYLFTVYDQRLPVYSSGRMSLLLKEMATLLVAAGVPFHLLDLQYKDARSTCSKMTLDEFGREAAATKLNHSVAMSAKAYSTEDKRVILQHLNILGGELSHN